jgi:exopolyphosphatase/guanosine-5'-triphosphate,3'-diphosphate pyrophosphatase
MVDEVAAMIAPFAQEHGGAGLRGIHMLGTSGTVTTIAGVHLNLKRYDRNRVDGCWMSAQEINTVLEKLLSMTYEDRVASPCIGAERADLVLAGCAILEAIRRAFPCPRLRVADRGLREGMLVQMMRDDGVWGGGNQAAAS